MRYKEVSRGQDYVHSAQVYLTHCDNSFVVLCRKWPGLYNTHEQCHSTENVRTVCRCDYLTLSRPRVHLCICPYQGKTPLDVHLSESTPETSSCFAWIFSYGSQQLLPSNFRGIDFAGRGYWSCRNIIMGMSAHAHS